MKYIIFGGSGFIGTHLINLIKEANPIAEIYNLDILENNHSGKSISIYCDVRKKIDANIETTSDDIIFNLAAVHRTPGHLDFDYFETNIKGAENICEFANNNNINQILFTSSIAPYGANESIKTEETLPTPNTPYGISKLVAEKIQIAWQAEKKGKRSLIIVRPGIVFGKGENGNFTRLYWGIKKKKFLYPGRKDTIKAAIYVKDLVGFMLYKIEAMDCGKELYNCTFEPAFTIEEIVNTMSKATNIKAPTIKINAGFMIFFSSIIGVFGGEKLGIHPDRVKKLMISTNISGEKLRNSGYIFKYTLESAIIDWYNDNNNKFLK